MNKNIIAIILILGFIAVVVLLDIPKVQGVLDLKEQIKNQQKTLEEKKFLIGIVEKLHDDYEENKETLNKLEYIMPNEQEVPNVIVQLEAIAAKGGLILRAIDIATKEDKNNKNSTEEALAKDYQFLTINIKLTGDYAAFKRFLDTIEENIRLMDVESINFISQSEMGASFFDFDVVFKVYYQ